MFNLLQKGSVELVDGVNVGEEQRHQALWHGVLLDHSTAEPLPETQTFSSVSLLHKFIVSMKIPAPAVMGKERVCTGKKQEGRSNI